MAAADFAAQKSCGLRVVGARPIPARAGIGLRMGHHQSVIERPRAASWLETHPENYMTDAAQTDELETIRRDHPLSLHAIGLSLGSADGVDEAHLARLAALVARFEPGLVSDHLSWSAAAGFHFPDLLPLPYSQEALAIVARNIDKAQSVLKRAILVENPSSYFRLAASVMSEAAFLGELAARCGCGVLLDINNVYVSARNCGEDPSQTLGDFLTFLAPDSICEIHLAGHATHALESGSKIRLDDHGSPVCAEVWRMYETAIARLGPRPTLIEWDTDLPSLDELLAQAQAAQTILDAHVDPAHVFAR